jgi:pSer/pThr/pTyr-binding forkhead associated (FHA) protein
MPARLTVHLPFQPTKSFLAVEGEEYVIGRDAECDLALEDERISRRHARLGTGAGGWLLTDLGSKNGTAVNGLAVTASPLSDRSLLSFGGVVGEFELVTDEERRADTESRLRRWQTSLALRRRLDASQGVEELLERLLASVFELSGTDRGFVMLVEDGDDLEVVATRGVGAAELGNEEFAGSAGAIERTLARQRPVVLSDAQADTLLGERPSVVTGGIRALVCLPLAAMDRLIGVLYADSRRAGARVDDLDVEVLEALAGHAALAIAVARVNRELQGLLAALPAAAASPPAELGDDLRQAWARSFAAYPPERADAGAHRRAGSSGRTTWTELRERHLVPPA